MHDGDGIVVIGASLGGLHAITEVLRSIPADFPLPIAFVQHRSPTHADILVRLLRRSSSLQVKEPADKEPILPRFLYLAPADYHLLVDHREFALSTGEAVSYARPSIDVLFESAAEAYGSGTIGVVLTGANHDGSAGAARIRQFGGRVIIQEPATAECAVMPQSALDAAGADEVLILNQIGDCLSRWA
jgi:two-component system, chemotaxis family, protein-glutamate methylesterase/glutaminase